MNKALLTKTCASCGMQKPLTAFLQLAGPNGTTYGNICSTCRSMEKDKATAPKETDDHATNTIGLKVDQKSKVEADLRKRKWTDKERDEYYSKREKTDADAKRSKLKETQKQSELDIRDTMWSKTRPVEKPQKQNPLEVHGSEAQIEKERQTNLINPFLDTQHTGKIKWTQSPEMRKWVMGLLPDTSPLKQVVMGKKQETQKVNTPEEFAEKKWSPKKR